VIGCRGEPGPEEIAAAGGGIALVEAGDVAGLADTIDELVTLPEQRAELGRVARATVERTFTWERCGAATVAAYAEALR
jgi:glycosyltransferase involved in cell wall biosynthesis